MSRPLLEGIRVLELAEGVAGPYAGKLLGDLGAHVVKVEPPDGDVTRAFGPFPGDVPDPRRSGLFIYLNAGKQRIVLDQSVEDDRAACLQLAASVDVVIDDFAAGASHLNARTLRAASASLVVVSVTPFGQSGPHAAWRGNDMIAFHSSGFAFGFPALQVDNDSLPPLNAPTYAAEFLSGQIAAAAAMHGLLTRQQTGRGAHLDVSLQEAVAAANNSQFNAVQFGLAGTRRIFSDKPSNSVVALLPCTDGWIAISPREEHQWQRWLEVMDRPDWSDDPRYRDRSARERNWADLYPLLADWTRSRAKATVFQEAQAQRVACMPLGNATDLLSSAQLAAREFFVEVDDSESDRPTTVPGRPYRIRVSDTGLAAADQVKPTPDKTPTLRPLTGVRVIDFGWVLTGPICTRQLAALGAEVIKVESATRPDLSQRNFAWEELNPSKRSITLNLKQPRARELAQALIARSDVVIENFSTGVMERLGLDYSSLQQVNPRVIMASSSAFGRTGPDREQVAYGTLIQALTGWAALSAYPDHPPRSAGGVWTDPLTAGLETFLVLAAIWRQRESGAGCFIDLSMTETTIAALPEPVLAWSLAQNVLQPRGNRHPVYAPQGCYPALGDDRWVALSIQSDEQWAALCRLMDRTDLLDEGRFSTRAGRHVQHDALDLLIAQWTAQRSAEETAATLQAHGIAATATLTPGEIVRDEHLCARSFIRQIQRLDRSGTLSVPGTPWLIDQERPRASAPAPPLGQDNDYVFKTVLGLDEVEYNVLIRQQVIY